MSGFGFKDDPAPEQERKPRGKAVETFTTKRELEPVYRERGTDLSMRSFSIRVHTKSANEFVDWCNRARLTYREGFDQLVELISLLDRPGPKPGSRGPKILRKSDEDGETDGG
jgi:hypothetical protein